MKTLQIDAAVSKNATPIQYIHNARFDHPESLHDILEAISQLPTAGDRGSVLRGDDFSLKQAPLLNRSQEEILFLRMNLLKCLAARKLRSGNVDSIDGDRVASRLLAEAEETRDRIVAANQRLVISTASKFRRYRIPLADLISEANMALLRAIDRFNVGLGFRFSTYATLAMRRHLQRLTIRDGKSPFAASETLPDLPVDEEHPDWLDIHPSGIVREVLESLTPREEKIVKYRFGLTPDGRSRTLREIGSKIGMSKERVRQVLDAVMLKARQLNGVRLSIS